MPDPEDVISSASSADPDPNNLGTAAAAVSAVGADTIVDDRPLKNIIAELDRKAQQREEERFARLMSMLTPARTPAPSTTRDYSDEELAQLAAAGDASAQLKLTDRLAARHAAQQTQAYSQQQTEAASLNALFGRYPVLRDSSHALTQYAMQVKTALLQGGHSNTVATVIESIKTAIADNPDLAAQSAVRTTPSSVPRATAPTAAAASPAPRRSAPASKKVALDPRALEIAKRMGLSPERAEKAIERTRLRRESGQSGLGAVRAFVREEL